MGHYDDCYASEEYSKLSKEEVRCFSIGFLKRLKKEGCIHGTFDDVNGQALISWARKNNYKVKIYYKKFTVLDEIDKDIT
jgi:hypothetical protein